MNQIFLGLLNNAVISSILILAVIITRIFIKRAPKWITCALWGIVAIKLVFPFGIESALSLVPSAKLIPADIEYQSVPQIESGVPVINRVVNPVLESNFTPNEVATVNPMQVVVSVASMIWIIGITFLCLYSFASYLLLRKKVAASQNTFDNVYVCDEVGGPFILGIIRPRVYLPSGIATDTLVCVLEHEKAHLKRFDHLWKPLGFSILSVYWFNPLCWIAYVFLCKDIELACDEKVTKDKDKNWKATYCQALLDCNAQRRIIAACPIAFGEVNVKDRIKSVLNYKKPAFWIVIAAIVLSIVVAVCFMTNPKKESDTFIEGITVEYVPAEIDENTMPGADGAQIACANEGYIVFYDYYGLFVYGIANRRLQTSLSLEAIGCSATQGDEAVEIFMENDSDMILIHKMNSDSMYIFDYKKNNVEQVVYDETRCTISSNLVNLFEYIKQDYTVFQSYQAYLADFSGTKGLIWLESGSGLPIDLALHIKLDWEDGSEDGEVKYIFQTEDTSSQSKTELTMQTLVRLVTAVNWDKNQRADGVNFWKHYSNLLDDEAFSKDSLTNLMRAQLEYDNTEFEIQVYYWPEDSAKEEGHTVGDLVMIRLRNIMTDDAILLFSTDNRDVVNTDIERFLLKKYDLPQEILSGNECGMLDGEISFSNYNVDLFLNFAGCLFENRSYKEPTHGEGTPMAWYSLGGVGVCIDPNYDSLETFVNGDLIEYQYMDNHMSCDLMTVFNAGEYSGCLYRYNMDLVTASEADLLKKGEPTESEYWVVFFTKGQGEPLYIKFFNCDYYTQDDALEGIAPGVAIIINDTVRSYSVMQ